MHSDRCDIGGKCGECHNKIVDETGRIDGLVANAGMTKHQPALKFDRPELEKLFNVNVGKQISVCAHAMRYTDKL